MGNQKELEGLLVGSGVALAVGFAQADNDTQRRLRQNQRDARTALSELTDLEARGDMIRSRLAVVQDAQVGLAVATSPPNAPSLLPSTTAQTRPDLSANMEVAAEDMQWPPRAGTYTANGYIESIGELTTLFTSLTYEEVRSILQGLVQAKQPKANQKVQMVRAANALVATLYGLDLTWDEYVAAWKRLFGPGGAASDPHKTPSRPPTVNMFDPTIASVVALGTPDINGYPTPHLNTDQASKWRITVGNNVVPANTNLFQVQFGSPYMSNGGSYTPVVIPQVPMLYPAVATNTGFVVRNMFSLGPNSSIDVAFTTITGQQ